MIYNPSEIEKKWIEVWEKEKTYITPKRSNRPKSYVLGMFPYPSGEGLHTGHGRIFTAVDVIGRYQRMKGYDVLMPMGWDSFGLPAENAAIKAKKNPMDMVPHNEANFKRQMMMLGWSYDWEREFSTTDPAYYKWTQWFFLKLYSIKNDKGERLIYRKEVPINWCPFCKTGLANEEVQADGTHERCGTAVTQKLLPQWNMRITDYADRLLADLESKELDWPKGILEMQKNWIGKKEGFKIKFGDIEVFTTRPETVCGATFLAVAGKENKDTGKKVVNPATGKEIPVWEADYIMADYGTGAIMGVPAHDDRDREFASKMGLPFGSGELGEFEAEKCVTYHLRDWVFSRQRYWGEPFPLVYCSKCGDENGVVPLSEDQLPLTLPYLESYEPTDTGQSPLSRIKEWVETTCPNCGGPARRETDTMPNWAGSCWYFLRFADPHNDKEAWSEKAMRDWLPVDWYLGGAEHAVLHLLYARFWTKTFKDLGLINFSEPFLRLRSVGMVLAADGKKMSKSLGNVINPDEVVGIYGADAVRVYELFMGPWDQAISWSERSLIGCRRFVEKVWNLARRDIENKWKTSDQKLMTELNRVIAKVGEDIVALKFNTAVAALMKFANSWSDCMSGLSAADLSRLVLALAPMAPFMTEELWRQLGNNESIHLSSWPQIKKIVDEEVNLVVQVEGKTRNVLRITNYVSCIKNEVEKIAVSDEKVKKWIEGKKYEVVFVPGKIINFVMK
ncbi:leucine--tRNA ligase [Candidatus Collierbacteria bacterium]|nr:leucine--tRNA ligase [Candidatus Collierbacteria bacterium]